MNVTKEHLREIRKIARTMKCQKDFECYKSSFTKLCKAKDLGMENYLECRCKKADSCEFSILFGAGFFCKCRLRYFIARNIEKMNSLQT